MVASSSSTASAGRPQPLSYAERAKRAGASAASQSTAHAHPATTNGVTRVDDGSTSHASSSMNDTSNAPAATVHPASPVSPQLLPVPNTDEPQSFPPVPKSPSKPPPPNVWMARKEQMARVAVQQQPPPTATQLHSGNAEKPAVVPRAPLNGIANTSSHSEPTSSAPNKSPDDPFVVRIPAHSRSPPSLDDTESWPEMGKHGPSASTSTSVSTTAESSSGGHKKGEKPKWVPIPPSELQATHDALAAQSSAKSRTHSQHRRSNPTKSHSRHQSQARQGQGSANAVSSNGMRQFGFASNEASAAQSRAESTTHSRTTSVHSSPRYPTRGRRLPEERANDMHTIAGPSTGTKKLINGEVAPGSSEVQPTTYQHAYSDNVADPAQNLTGPHSQSHTPYSSHSPVYYPPPVPPNSSVQPYGYSAMPPNVGYTVMPPPPVPGLGHASAHAHHQQNYTGYPPYGLPQHLPPNQPPYPYMYAPAPFPYYALQAPGQSHERPLPEQPLLESQEPEAAHVSPNLPPASALTRPPPPEQSAALAGYRAIAAVPVSPFLGASDSQPNICEVAETSGEVVFGSLGRPDGMKSPSPVSSPVAVDNQPRRTPTAFAVGFEGPPTIRMKRSGSTKDGTETIVDAVKVIDLTDQETTWEFGTSAHPDADPTTDNNESDNVPGPGQASQIVQPQPHMIHYPPPPVPPIHQAAGYNIGPPTHLPMSVSLPIPSQSPLGPVQPPPQHVPSLGPLSVGPGFVSPLALASPGPGPGVPGPVSAGTGTGDEWEVRDFGYGFGALSGSGYIPERLRSERFEREHRDGYREPREFVNNGFGASGRGRRGGGANGFGGYYEGGRGGFGGRRGRGGPNGFGRGFSRGGFAGRGGHGAYQRHQPVLNVVTGPFHHQPGMHTPHNQQQPQLHPHQVSPDVPNGYYSSPSAASSQYVTSPYGQYNPGLPLPLPPQPQLQPPVQPQSLQQAPPMPMPVTALSFPLDPVGHYLLGQVEYYFSIQNLMSDVFLKKQMDSKGWIPIDLIASFNRIKRLTTDVRMVADVLGLSSLVEVRDGHVRLVNRQWVNFVLPGARASTVGDGNFDASGSQSLASGQHVGEEAEKEVDEEEEDDVVFVLGGEESRPWALDRDRPQTTAAGNAS